MFQKIMLRKMQTQANELVDRILEIYEQEKKDWPTKAEKELLATTIIRYYNIPRDKVNEELLKEIGKKCICIESVCYFCGFSTPIMKNAIILRSAQFLAMIDKKLAASGQRQCSKDDKLKAYDAVKMKDAYISNPEIFN